MIFVLLVIKVDYINGPVTYCISTFQSYLFLSLDFLTHRHLASSLFGIIGKKNRTRSDARESCIWLTSLLCAYRMNDQIYQVIKMQTTLKQEMHSFIRYI